MEYEAPTHSYSNGDYLSCWDLLYRIEYITNGGARILRVDEEGHASFWVPNYFLNRMEYRGPNNEVIVKDGPVPFEL
jgi:hypothetical protein